MAYVTVAEVRNEGLVNGPSDARVQTSIDTWQQFIERVCRQFFEPKTITLDVDGNDSDTLFLPVPIISVTSLFINDDFANLVPAEAFRAYNGRGPIDDDRRNPKIRLIRRSQAGIFVAPFGNGGPFFYKGYRNQRIVGSWGFTEADGSTPKLIKRALIQLVLQEFAAQGGAGGLSGAVSASPGPAGPVQSETTDGHTITYSVLGQTTFEREGTVALTGDEAIDKILELYRAPIAMAVPGSLEWFKG